jgi:hypothetical protein
VFFSEEAGLVDASADNHFSDKVNESIHLRATSDGSSGTPVFTSPGTLFLGL